MKKQIISCYVIFLLLSVLRLDAQNLKSNSFITGVCYAGNKVNRMYIPPPANYFKNRDSKGGASIDVIYNGFSTQAKVPVEKAVAILESLLSPEVKMTVVANWIKISTIGVLANSSTTGYASGWSINALTPWALYPVALAEKIKGESINGDADADIILNINSTVNWYLGIDGKPTLLRFDLVTVALHELIHGMGFFDSMNVDASGGSYGSFSVPVIYDTFIENRKGQNLTDTFTFKNPSIALTGQLTSGQLYFSGPLLYNYTTHNSYSSKKAKLWAPTAFDAGSSISHLDDDSTLLVDGLMRPFIDREAAIHSPGKLILSILGDLGWINTRIIHKPHSDTEENLSEIYIKAAIASDTIYDTNKVGLVWSFDKFVTSDTAYLIKNLADTFITTVQVPAYNSKLDYYLFVKDCFSRIYRLPSLIDSLKFSVYIGKDTVKPVLIHSPIGYYFEKVDSVKFLARASDNIGIDTVYVEYILNNGTPSFIGLIPDSDGGFTNGFDAGPLSLKGEDSLRYRIIALDKAAESNQTVLPATGYYTIKIESLNPVADSYSTDFTDAAPDFFNIGFNIIQPAAFSGKGLHTNHPYESPERNNDSIIYTSFLRTPVKFDSTGMRIRFMELVLVEPGETGSLFGSPDFYDYVIVEGSENFGKTWFRFSDGYDSRYVSSWLTAYNSAITEDGNSTYIGQEPMLLQHTFTVVESKDISPGDTLVIRFRLFSDPFANGWGWIIDDLHVGPVIDGVSDINYQQYAVYPNPGNGMINIRNTGSSEGKPLKYSIFNGSGYCIMTGITSGGDTDIIDITGNPSGIYFIVVNGDKGIRALKYSLIK